MTSHLLAMAASLALLAGCATSGKPADEKPSGREQTLVEMRAVVIGADQERRLLALEGDDGRRMVLLVAEEFRDFERARVGDQVVVSYMRAIAWQVKPSDQGAPGVSTRETLSNARPGQAPGGTIERALTITATITALDMARGTVTLTAPQGEWRTFAAHQPSDLEKIRVGDLVDITYSEALAVAALAGRSSDYLLSTSTGAMIESTGKPVLNERTGMYEYRTKGGKDAWIHREQVVEILER